MKITKAPLVCDATIPFRDFEFCGRLAPSTSKNFELLKNPPSFAGKGGFCALNLEINPQFDQPYSGRIRSIGNQQVFTVQTKTMERPN